MKDFFKEAFEYTFTFNDKIIDSLLVSERVPEKADKLINHTLNAHEIWNARIRESKPSVRGLGCSGTVCLKSFKPPELYRHP